MIERLAKGAAGTLATLGDGAFRLEVLKRLHRGSDNVNRIVAAQGLGQDVPDPGDLDDGPDATARDDSGTRRRWLEQHAGRTECRFHLMGNRSAIQGHRDHRLLGGVSALADAVRHLASLAKADTDLALAVADHDNAAERKGSSALVDF